MTETTYDWPAPAPGAAPLLEGTRLAIVSADPRETDDAGRSCLAGAGVSLQEAPAFAADPAGAAAGHVGRRASGAPASLRVTRPAAQASVCPLTRRS